MLPKNALAQALFYALLTLSMHIKAMDAPHQETTTFSNVTSVNFESLISRKNIKVCLQVEVPSNLSLAASIRYYLSREEEVKAKFEQFSRAYCQVIKNRGEKNCCTIIPQQLNFNVDTNTVTLKHCLGTHQLTNTITADLQEQVASTFNPAQQQFENKRATVHITFQTPDKEPITLDLAMLHELYNNKQTLNLRPETQRAVLDRQIEMAATRDVNSQIFRQDVSSLPDPDVYLERLHTEDVKTMVTYYLTNFDCLDID